MEDREREREVDNAARDRIHTAIAFVVVTTVTIFMSVVAVQAILKYDFKKAEARFFEGFDYSFSPELWERVPDLYIYPWSEYHKHSTRELSQEQGEFLRGKRVAECMVDMVNYDEVLIGDKESAASLLYEEGRRLLTEDDREYYVWNKVQIVGIFLFGMANMKGEIFSFHYVTDMECDEEEAVQYVMENFENQEEDYYSLEQELNAFSSNRTLFIKNINKKLIEYENLDTTIFYKDIDLDKKPTINEENGSVVLIYLSKTKTDYFVFLYLDCKTKKVSGYHLMLY